MRSGFAKKRVYFFGNAKAEGSGKMKDILGGKGAGLSEMTNLGIPVPPGFIISTEVCTLYNQLGKKFTDEIIKEVEKNLHSLEEAVGKKFGDKDDPLLVSIRSGARVSMPGMMDTVLNVGLNDASVEGLGKKTNNMRFAYDSYRRFISMYSNVVLEIPYEQFEDILEQKKRSLGVRFDTDLSENDLKDLAELYKETVQSIKGASFPLNPMDQLWEGIKAVFNSWYGQRAATYRRINKIPDGWGTAVNVVSMVFGNMGDNSATGVVFTRNPATGEGTLYGEFLPNAQGEDVVAGIRTPRPIVRQQNTDGIGMTLEEKMPHVFEKLQKVAKTLESRNKDMQDIEFTIERNTLWILQTRSGKRTASSAIKIAVDMVSEGLISKEDAIMRVSPEQLNQILHPVIDPNAEKTLIAKGLPASPGAVSGSIVLSANDAVKMAKEGHKVILVRIETSPEDIHGMHVAEGVLTSRGGMTSHAAVVARGMGRCCVVGCSQIKISYERKTIEAYDTALVFKEGDVITLDGTTGEVFKGVVPTIDAAMNEDFATFMKWVDEVRRLRVMVNADTPDDCKIAMRFGAEGVGLCRTEHMFFAPGRINAVREMILAKDKEGRRRPLNKIKPMQKADFIGIFKEMGGLPVVIRLLDPPLHEFLPKTSEDVESLAKTTGVDVDVVRYQSDKMHEFNPMLGHRGCRLGITMPEIYEMQTEAIIEAACELKKTQGKNVNPEIMVPLVGSIEELTFVKVCIDKVAKDVMERQSTSVNYKVGTMIELPRACLIADDIAKEAEFFSFGTNDLTQMTFGFSRDDVGIFLAMYLEKKILKADPFQTIDIPGVGRLIEMAVIRGKQARPDIKVGICGEHGGDPSSVHFCHSVGLDYVSCSPFRVPIAKLAAAQAVLEEKSTA